MKYGIAFQGTIIEYLKAEHADALRPRASSRLMFRPVGSFVIEPPRDAYELLRVFFLKTRTKTRKLGTATDLWSQKRLTVPNKTKNFSYIENKRI